jgi:cbb3-type cytochrome c oxidase subunit III
MKRYKHLLLWTSLGTLTLLGWAAFEENTLQQWRSLQRAYRSLLPPEQQADFEIQLRQVVVPALGASDRCVSCHVGMAIGPSGLPQPAVFRAHPAVVHDPSAFGCVVCHGGQGRATEANDAHGDVPHWPEPMIPRRYAYAGCGSCHTHLQVPGTALLERGSALFERHDCLACHALDGRGGTLRPGGRGGMAGPDLSRVGATGHDEHWYEGHLRQHREASGGPWREAFGPLPPADLAALRALLDSRVGAPGLVESKALFHSLGCRGCHKIGGIGGDDGPDLTREGQRDPGQLDFAHVPGGGRNLTGWFQEHFRAPATVVPGSTMPALGLSEPEIDALTFYMFSLRRSDVPEAFWPEDRIRAERFDEREFATDGATLYGSFCAACHGPAGEGMRYAGMVAFPAIANPDFLERASDEFLREAVRRGRPGRRMPAWGELEGGLRPHEIDAVVAFLRQLGGVPAPAPDARPRRWVEADPARGAALYAASCAPCHGERGDGGAGREGTALANRVLLETASDTYLVESIRVGRRGTSMPGFAAASPVRGALEQDEIESIVAHIRSFGD